MPDICDRSARSGETGWRQHGICRIGRRLAEDRLPKPFEVAHQAIAMRVEVRKKRAGRW